MSNSLTERPHAETLPMSSSAAIFVEGRYIPPPQDGDGKIWVRTTALVGADPDRLYKLWRDVKNAPLWQEQISAVTTTGDKTSHWVMRSGEKTIEWDSEILMDQPGRRIAWRSIGGESDNAGEVIFDVAHGKRGTIVTVLQMFRMGKLTSMWETIVGCNPKQSVIENLRHFKALAETGEIPRIEGQPHGPRGTVATVKRSMYGEKIATPPGESQAASKVGGGR
jgi:uncharacterized membrane protein